MVSKHPMNVLSRIENARIVVCCGSGGVGKTTISAMLGFHGAMRGRKTLVLTIDPARRLADALGLGPFGGEPQRIPLEKIPFTGESAPGGELHAMMLDTKGTFDNLIGLFVKNENARQRIFENRYYQHISRNLAGSHEYMAMEKLLELYRTEQYDLIVLDTPPSRRALDFLEAPRRFTTLLGNNVFWRLFKPYLKAGFIGLKFMKALTAPLQKMVDKVLGTQVFEDLVDFFQMGDTLLFKGLADRAEAVNALLGGEETVFLAIATPLETPMREALFLYEKLCEFEMPFAGFLINRVHPVYPGKIDSRILKSLRAKHPDLVNRLLQNYQDFQTLGRSHAEAISGFREKIGPDVPVQAVPVFDSDIHDFSGILKIHSFLNESECFAG